MLDTWSPEMKAFVSWQGHWTLATIDAKKARALGQMRHHWQKMSDAERREVQEMLLLPPLEVLEPKIVEER